MMNENLKNVCGDTDIGGVSERMNNSEWGIKNEFNQIAAVWFKFPPALAGGLMKIIRNLGFSHKKNE
jgi:hypothetical protein